MKKLQQFTPDEDSQLLLSWHRGDLSAFETLVWKYQKRIFNLAILLTGDREAAATATENSFLTAFQDIRSLTGRSRFSTWLVAIALKECRNLNYFRSAESASEPPAKAGHHGAIDAADTSALFKILASCIKDLPVELTEVILLRYVRGYSLEKLEEIFQIRPEILLSRLFEAEEALTACLKSGQNRSDDAATPHPEIRRNFSAYLDSSTADVEKATTKEHLKSCGSCREALTDLEWMIEHLRSLPDEEPPPWLTSSIMQKAGSIPEEKAEVKNSSPLAIRMAAGMIILAIIGLAIYLLTTREEIPSPGQGGESSRIESSAVKSGEKKTQATDEPASFFKGVFRGAGLLEDKKPKSPLPSPQGNLPSAAPSLPLPVPRPELPAAPLKTVPTQKREYPEKSPQLPTEWGDSPPPHRLPQKKAPPARHDSGEMAVVLTTPDPVAAIHEIEAAVTSLGGRITGRAYSGGNDILYTRIEVEKLIELMGRLGKVGKIQELPELPENAEGMIDLVIKW